MKWRRMKRRSTSWLLPIVIGLLISAAPGCQTPGELVSEDTSQVCPECRTETRTFVFEGLTYKRHFCPRCKTMDAGTEFDETVHYCDKCDAIVEPCRLCQKE